MAAEVLPEGAIYPITIYQGADFRARFELREADEVTVIDLTGYAARAEIRKRQKTNADLLGIFACTVDAEEGSVTIHLTSAQTSTFTARKGYYDVFLIDESDQATMLIEGEATINPGVTDVAAEA